MSKFLLGLMIFTCVATHATEMPMIAPEAVAKLLPLSAKDTTKPLLIHVGFESLYKFGHIPGSTYLGPTKEGVQKLHAFLEKQPRDREIILYCGCCPMTKCPNVHPALEEVTKMGFKNVKVLDLPENFGKDWAKKGYPVEKG